MSATAEDLVARGLRAFRAGDLTQAQDVMSRAVEEGEAPEARMILGGLAFAREDYAQTQDQWEAAFRAFKEAGDLRGAALAATYLGSLFYDVYGNESASKGWLSRAARLLERAGRCVERGYYELASVACNVRDASALEESAAVALDLALEFNDPDLEARALADGGLALINQGRLKEGFARLDEAMVPVASGEIRNPVQGAMICCALLTSCERTGDLRRAEEWTQAAANFDTSRWDGRLQILHSHCRLAYGAVLCDTGNYSEGEAQLLTAMDPASNGAVPHRADAAGALAAVRLLQGRVDEAAELLAPYMDRFEVCEPLARLHFARAEYDLAAAVIDRALHDLVGDRLRAGRLLRLLVDVELGRNDVTAAEGAAERLADYAEESDSPVLRADSRLADGRVSMRNGDTAAAIEAFEAGLDDLSGEQRPILSAIIRLDLAQAHVLSGRPAAAVDEARSALACFERLGATRFVERAAEFLKGLEPAATPT